jgi:hypothetical protein
MPSLNPKYFLRKGIVDFYRRQLPAAYDSFAKAAQSQGWQVREAVAAGLADMISPMVYAEQKRPSVIDSVNWTPPDHLIINMGNIADHRLMVMAEGFLQQSRFQPQNLMEHKFREAMQNAFDLLGNLMINDPAYPVRFSAALFLTHQFRGEQQMYIQMLLDKAAQRETNDLVRSYLQQFTG